MRRPVSRDVSSLVRIFNQISYFCSADKNRSRGAAVVSNSAMSAPSAHAREPHQMRAISWWILSREVRRNRG
jgi:hypothetical protein